MEEQPFTTQKQTQGIKSGILIIVLASLHRKGVQQRGLKQPQATEIEIVADAAREIVDHWMFLSNGPAIDLFFRDVIRIHHRSIRVAGHTKHSVERSLSQCHLHRLRQQKYIVGFGILCHLHQRIAAL